MAKKVELSAEDLGLVEQVIVSVWGQIAYDLGDVDDNEQAIECCIDADRLVEFNQSGRSRTQARNVDGLVKGLVAKHGYLPVLKYLSKNIRLV